MNSTITFFALTYCANVLEPNGILKERIQFYYAAFGFPAISTFCTVLDAGQTSILLSPFRTFDRNLKIFKLRMKKEKNPLEVRTDRFLSLHPTKSHFF